MSHDASSSTARAAAIRLWALFVGVALLLTGNGLQGSLLGVVAEDSGFPNAITGLIMTAYFAGFLVGSISAQSFICAVGHVRTFAALASLGSIAILIHGLFIEPITWIAMRFLTGFSFAGLYVVAESWLNRDSDSQSRGTLLAIYMIVVHAGLAFGQVLLSSAPTTGLELYVFSSIVLSGALIPILLSSAPQPHVEPDVERLILRKLLKASPLGVNGCFVAGIANGIVLGMAAVYGRRLGLETDVIAAFVAAIMVGGAVFQWPIGKLSDQMDRRIVIAGVSALMVVCSLLLNFASDSVPFLVLSGFLLGGMVLTLYPLCLAYTNDWLDPGDMVAGSSSLVMIYGAGAVLGPIGTGLLMTLMGTAGFSAYLIILGIILTAYTAYRITRREACEAQEDYLPAPATMASSEYYAETAIEGSEQAEAG